MPAFACIAVLRGYTPQRFKENARPDLLDMENKLAKNCGIYQLDKKIFLHYHKNIQYPISGIGENEEVPAMKYVIGCDNAAVGLKNTLKAYMESLGAEVEDVGCYESTDPTYYPVVAERLCKKIIDSGYTMRGVLICGTGLGMAMCANKFPGIRAGVCHDGFSAERLALSNNGNVICFGERVVGPELAKKNLKEWMGLTFKDGPSTPKVQAICDIEAETMK